MIKNWLQLSLKKFHKRKRLVGEILPNLGKRKIHLTMNFMRIMMRDILKKLMQAILLLGKCLPKGD